MFLKVLTSLLVYALSAQLTWAECKIGKIADLPVTMVNRQPIGTAKINGTEVTFTVDSGAFYSIISPASAAELKLKLSPGPYGFRLTGVNGEMSVSVATVKVFTIAGVDVKNVEFIVGGSHAGSSVGVLGQNVLHIGDVEYDFANGAIRLLSVKDCSHASLAYWVGPTENFSMMDISYSTALDPHTRGIAYLNGKKIRVIFDTGAATSILSMHAAAEAGVTVNTPGVKATGEIFGFGREMVREWIAPFSNFKIGDEEIRNIHLRIGEVQLPGADMLLGTDFFLSHRIFVSNAQRRLYFTYNGGPVFNLNPIAAHDADPGKDANPVKADDTMDAPGYSRRGTASAARHDYEHAIADLNRACDLAPAEPDYVYERGMIYWESGQPAKAREDFDRAIVLKTNHIPALLARAELQIQLKDRAPALADLDAADRAATSEADARLRMGFAYEHLDQLPAGIIQLNLWITTHPEDARLGSALNGRCWMAARSATDLGTALDDCDAALRHATKGENSAADYAARGLIRLRQGNYAKAIDDFDVALKSTPRNFWAQYGRGVAKSHTGKAADGQADLAAATALWKDVPTAFEKLGLAP